MAVHDPRQTGYDPPTANYPPGATPAAEPMGQPVANSPWRGQPVAQPAPGQVPQAQPVPNQPAQAYPAAQPVQPQAAYPQAQPQQQPAQGGWQPTQPVATPYVPPAMAPVAQPASAAAPGFPGIEVNPGPREQAMAAVHPAQRKQAEAQQPDSQDEEEEGEGWSLPSLASAPPWLVSLITHMAILLALGLMIIPFKIDNRIEFEAVYASDIGEQLDNALLQTTEDPLDIPNPMLSLSDQPEVEDPLAAPPNETIDDYVGETSISDMSIPTVGLALSGREEGMKRALLARYGGNAQTELAVEEALKWLKRNQLQDGSWSLHGPYSDGVVSESSENHVSATAMALLAFQGAGHTHLAGEYKAEVAKGWSFLLPQMDANGDFWTTGVPHHRLYSQAQATIALCELYGMTEDPELAEPAQLAINFAVRSQSPQGGWRYSPGNDSDTSVTGWFVMALQSGVMAGLEVPPATLSRVIGYLDSADSENGTRYGYTGGGVGTLPMTAEGLLCRQYLGWEHDDERLQAGVRYLSANPIDFSDQNVYYWYYATQVVHHMEGEAWTEWNRVLREVLPAEQVMQGAERGSWDPGQDRWGVQVGRLYTTCLSVYMLEVYYRHLPVYSNLYDDIE